MTNQINPAAVDLSEHGLSDIEEIKSAADDSPLTVVNFRNVDRQRDDITPVDRRTQFGNPFRLTDDGGEYTRRESVISYLELFTHRMQTDEIFAAAVENLSGKIGCWCVPKLCHAHVIAAYRAGTLAVKPTTP